MAINGNVADLSYTDFLTFFTTYGIPMGSDMYLNKMKK